ncbi:hypothetical protein OG711_08095 [Streptomyces uncialis]|uniref:hypothetical protein n=1 Tax=Streptomyces uncialis TaxID=1048205 RepID=UPI002E30BB53|nr:hypothetical protein [Streptomyces uncialis]
MVESDQVRYFPFAPDVEEFVEERFVVAGAGGGGGQGIRGDAFGTGIGMGAGAVCCGHGAFGVGGGCGAGAYGDGVQALEFGDGLGLGVVDAGDLPEVVLAVEVEVAAVFVGADGDGGPPVVGVQMDGEAACGDVVVDLLGGGADLAYLVAGQPGHWVVGPGPLGVDLLLQCGVDGHRVVVVGEILGCP